MGLMQGAQKVLTDISTSLSNIYTALTDGKTAESSVTDLTGYTYAERTAAGTTNVVTAGANTNGIHIMLAQVHTGGNTEQATILVAGNELLDSPSHATAGRIGFRDRDIKLPSGVALDLTTTAAGKAFVWYRLL